MPVRCANVRALAALTLLPAFTLLGCAAGSPWTFNTPPTHVESTAALRATHKTIVVIGTFADPTNAPPHAVGVGSAMSDAFSRALLNDGNYDVWINPQLVREAELIAQRREQWSDLAAQTSNHRGSPPRVGGTDTHINTAIDTSAPIGEHLTLSGRLITPDKVNFVVLGKVTDFLYTGDLPSQVSRRSILPPWGARNEAIVAIDLRIVDMKTRRVVGADHIRATVPARGSDASELHSAVPFDSYLFWSTPLGRAAKEAVQAAVAQTDNVVPPLLMDPRIEQMIAWRRVSIAGGSMAGVAPGQELYILLPNRKRISSGANPAMDASRSRGDWQPVRDAQTGQPLRVRIDTVDHRRSTGWLLGERPLEVSLRGALLAAHLPREMPEPAQGPLANAPAAVEE